MGIEEKERNSHIFRNNIKYRLFIPKYYNKDDRFNPGGEIEREKILTTKKELESLFGGLVILPVEEGRWIDSKGKEFVDKVYIFEANIGCKGREEEEEIKHFFKCYEELLKMRFRQESIYAEWLRINIESV